MRLERIIKLEKSFAEAVENIYRNGIRFGWSHERICEYYRKGILENEEYRKLPRYAHSFIEGVRHVMDKELWRAVVFSYEIKGKRLTIDSAEYRKVDAFYVHSECSHTGCYVFRSDNTKFFTQPETAYAGLTKPTAVA